MPALERMMWVGPGAINMSGDTAVVAAGGCNALNLLAVDGSNPARIDPRPSKEREFTTGRAKFWPDTCQFEPCAMVNSFFLQTRDGKAKLPAREIV